MAQEGATNSTPALASIGSRYPGKTSYLAQVFENTTNSYKLFWFLAILSLMKRRKEERSFRLADMFTEMAVAAWHPVCLYRLSLGREDKLQNVIKEILQISGLQPNAMYEDIRNFVAGSAEAQAMLKSFKRFVPTRFLTPWFAGQPARRGDDARRTREIETKANESQMTPDASLYYFERDSIRLNDSWWSFIDENSVIVQSFTEYYLTSYLQGRNPNVPGVVNKLRAPVVQNLSAARKFWEMVRVEFQKTGKAAEFKDIYTEQQLAGNFSVDHFLPRSFVMHNLLWNLTPVDVSTNSSKSDALPDLERYLPGLSKLHFLAIHVAKKRPKLLEDYTDCFKQDVSGLLGLNESELLAKYEEVIKPQAQIAMNLNFQPGWVHRN